MAEFTEIQWCDGTLNLWTGCTKVSEGCRFCYAEQMRDGRFGKGEWGPKGTRTEVNSWRSTLEKISKRAKAEGRRLRVFCQSMSDTFEGPETCGGVDSDNWRLIERLRANLFYEIPRHPHLDFLLLTKRPENIERTVRECWTAANRPGLIMPPNVWFGTSVENQEQADQRIPHLLKIPAGAKFLSCEPLLGPVRLDRLVDDEVGANWNALEMGIDWVICGGESGKDARPMHPDWARSLRDQCQKAGVAFHFKQWGEHACVFDRDVEDPDWRRCDLVKHETPKGQWLNLAGGMGFHGSRVVRMDKVGKKRAGRLLDGREWNEFPQVNP